MHYVSIVCMCVCVPHAQGWSSMVSRPVQGISLTTFFGKEEKVVKTILSAGMYRDEDLLVIFASANYINYTPHILAIATYTTNKQNE